MNVPIGIEKQGRVPVHNVVWACMGLCTFVCLRDSGRDKDRKLIYLQFSV